MPLRLLWRQGTVQACPRFKITLPPDPCFDPARLAGQERAALAPQQAPSAWGPAGPCCSPGTSRLPRGCCRPAPEAAVLGGARGGGRGAVGRCTALSLAAGRSYRGPRWFMRPLNLRPQNLTFVSVRCAAQCLGPGYGRKLEINVS